MKRYLFVWILVLALLLGGCGNAGEIEALEGELAGLHQRLDELEAENATLRAQLEEALAGSGDVEVNLAILDWEHADNELLIHGAFAQILNLPRVNGLVELPEMTRVVITHNGYEVSGHIRSLDAGEGDNALEGELEHLDIPLPELAEGDVLEVYLEVTMPNGDIIIGWGASWDYYEGRLSMTAG